MSAQVTTPQVLTPQVNASLTQLLTVSEVADSLRVPSDTVIRWFANRPGVINLGSPEDVRRRKRAYKILRIPRAVFEKFLIENRIQ